MRLVEDIIKPCFPCPTKQGDWCNSLASYYSLDFLRWHLVIVLELNHSALQIAYGNLRYFSKEPVGDSVPEDKIWRDQKFVGCADAI